jgi:hypothetical protein
LTDWSRRPYRRRIRHLAPLITAAALALLGTAGPAAADTPDPAARAASCADLYGGTVNDYDTVPWARIPEVGSLTDWPAAPAGLLPARVFLRGEADTYNARYAFATRGGRLYVAHRTPDAAGWREVPLPDCLAGHVASISADDDELVAIDDERRVFSMDNALKGPGAFNWSRRWGAPFWKGDGRTLPDGVLAWSWSVISPAEDRTWSDDAGNPHAVGDAKVSHIWALRTGGRRLTFMDPWLADDDSYEMCGPLRGRFRSAGMSASGSTVFVVGRHGDLYTRLFDFDLSGSDPAFFSYSYEPQRTGDPKAAIQLPSPGWVHQPKVPGTITDAISVEKTGVGALHRTLRVEGRDARGRTGYWEKDVRATAWRFRRTGLPLRGTVLDNPRRDTSRVGLGAAESVRYAGRAGGLRVAVDGFDVHCTPSTLTLTAGGRSVRLVLHSVDGLRLTPRSAGLDATPRQEYGNVEVPRSVLAGLARQPAPIRRFVAGTLQGRRFTNVSLTVTRTAMVLDAPLSWTLTR